MGALQSRVLTLLIALPLSTAVMAEVSEFSLPGDVAWDEAQESSLSPRFFLQPVDFTTAPDGIGPVQPQRIVQPPTAPAAIVGLDSFVVALRQEDRGTALTYARTDLGWTEAQIGALAAFFDSCNVFGRDVSRFDVIAQQDASVAGVDIVAGDVLVERLQDLPKRPDLVLEIIEAGVADIPVLVNVLDSFPKPTTASPPDSVLRKFNKNVQLTTLAFWETPLKKARRFELEPAQMFDGVAETGFERIDTPDADVLQKFRIWADLFRYFPISLVRIHNIPGDGFNLKAYTLYNGVPDTETNIAGFSYARAGNLGFPQFVKVADTFPQFVILQRAPVNNRDTITVALDPPRRLRYLRLDIDTDLDYTISEIQAFADGFLPDATYITRPLSLTDGARATLGRIFWEEDVVGDSSKSRAVVSVQTGRNTEPIVFFRFNDFQDEIEWRADGATVIDRRRDAPTFGSTVDLNEEKLRNDARAIFSALSNEERAAVRITRDEYILIPGNARAKSEPDLVFWSGVQPAKNGQVMPAPGGQLFFQIRVDLYSDDPSAGRVVRNLRFEYDTQRAASKLVGEVAPAVNIVAGRDTTFNVAIRAEFDDISRGFNRIQIGTPARISQVDAVSIDFGDGQVQTLERIPLGDARELGAGQFKEDIIDDNFFVVSVPRVTAEDAGDDSALLRLQFQGRVIDFNTTFKADVFLDTLGPRDRTQYSANGLLALQDNATGDPDTLGLVLPQGASAPESGESVVDFAAENQLEDRNSLSVTADISGQGRELVDNVGLQPNPFSPNTDGVNDALNISYDVLRLISPGTVTVEVHDLSGRRLAVLQDAELTSGGYSVQWTGRDDEDNLVPPGIYLLRLSVDADDRNSTQTHVVYVVY
ncbi:MAG: hypothetical protein HN712_05425 [Gemmatimonadetes bacterium]|jgi:hypothetical protein|nr:hypothetical protein [Gemmatimonadota bacterium]MBT6144153.1 hypothetical protein [Gemmatimonadota bacterium]MBT7859729.1 hypothetical protein [Gemmatimonadota bacterium]